jgi:hypothetical protein
VYRAVREYRQQFPDKAVLYSADSYDAFGWAVLLAGGSLASVPQVSDARFASAVAAMAPVQLPGQPAGQWAIGDGKSGLVLYREGATPVQVDLSALKGTFIVHHINPKTGQTTTSKGTVKGGQLVTLPGMPVGADVVWLAKK